MNKRIKLLIETFPKTYSEELGIRPRSGEPEMFKWFLASILFGHRIGETIAKNTYREFEKEGLTTPKRVLDAGWDELVHVLDNGGYVRYDFSTATTLLGVMKQLLVEYGSLENMHKKFIKQEELEKALERFKGVGPVTVNIFLRELRGVHNVDPLPSRFTIIAANNIELVKTKNPEKVLTELKNIWEKNKIKNKTFVNFETALLRLGKDYCNKSGCKICRFSGFCIKKRKV